MSLPTTLSTIGDLIDRQHGLSAWCEATINGIPCGHTRPLDLEALAKRLGRDHSYLAADLAPKLRCTKCGGRQIGLILQPPTGPAVRSQPPEHPRQSEQHGTNSGKDSSADENGFGVAVHLVGSSACPSVTYFNRIKHLLLRSG